MYKVLEKYYNYKLCYVDSSEYMGEPMTLYFTELDDVTKQWGDDWDDKPYEHNAGTPYTEDYNKEEMYVKDGKGYYPPIDIYKIVVDADYNIITPRTNQLNSPYCVKDINECVVPWLTITDKDDNSVFIKAGTKLKDVIDILTKSLPYVEIYTELRGEEDGKED